MDFRNLSEVDLKLNLLSGSSLYVGDLEIKPYTLKEINNIGFSRYVDNLRWLFFTIEDFINFYKDESKKKILEEQRKYLKIFDFYIRLAGKDMQQHLLTSLSLIFRTNDIKLLSHDLIVIGLEKSGAYQLNSTGELFIDEEKLKDSDFKIINRDNFEHIVHAVKLQNYLITPKDIVKDENPIDEETRKLMEHMRKMREKVEKIKKEQQQIKNNDTDIDISDIISAVSVRSNSINKFNIWDLTIYQLYDEYARLSLIDEYETSIRAMMAGAELKGELKHWSSKI